MSASRRVCFLLILIIICVTVGLYGRPTRIQWVKETVGNHFGLLVSKRFQDEEALFRDYGHLQQYQHENVALPPSNERIVMVGDSITAFWANPLNSSIKEEEPNFIFRAVGGSSTAQMLLRFRQDVLDLHPRVVVILGGTNDILIQDDEAAFEHFRNNIMTMCEMAADHRISIILGSIPPITDIGHKADLHHMESIPAWNLWLRHYATTIGAGFVDYYSALVGQDHEFRTDLTNDNIHPNKAGYARMQPILKEEVRRVESRLPQSSCYDTKRCAR